MDPQIVIVGTVGFIGVWAAYHAWTAALRTAFRQQLFALRDRLFIEAAEGSISFDDKAYGMLRTIIQQLLSMAEDVNAVQVFTAVVSAPWLRGKEPPLPQRFAYHIAKMQD